MNVAKQLFVRRPCSSSDDHSREKKQNESPTKKIEKFARKPQTVTYFPPYLRSPMKTSNEAQDVNQDKERFSQSKKLTIMNENSQSEAQSIQLDKAQTHDKETNQDLTSNIEEGEQQTEQFSIFAHLRASEQSQKPQNSEFAESNPNDSNLKSIDHEEEYLTSFNQGFFNKDQKQTIKQQQKYLLEYSPGQKSANNCTDEQRKKYCSFNLKELQDARKKEFDRRKSSQIFASIHPETIPDSQQNQLMLQSTITYNFAAEQSEKPPYSQKQSTYSLSYTKSYADAGNGLEQFSNLTKIKEQAQFFEEDHSTISANNQSKFSNQPNFGDSSRESDSVQKNQNLSVKYQIKPFVKPAETQIKPQYIRAAYVIEWKKEQTKEESNLPTGRSLINCPKHVLQRMGLDKKLKEHLLPIIQRAQQQQQMGQKLKEQVIVQNTQQTDEQRFQKNTLQCSISNNLPNSTQHEFEESMRSVSNTEHNVNDENDNQAQISRSDTQSSNVSEPFEDYYEIQTSRSQYTLTQLDLSENLKSQQSKEQHEIHSNFLHQNGYQSSESSSSQVSLKNSSCRPSYKNKKHVKSKAKPLGEKNNCYQAEYYPELTSKRAIQNKDQFYWSHMNKLDSLIIQILQMKKSFQNHYLSEINHQRNQCEKRTSEILSQLNQINEKLENKENLQTKKKQRQMSNNPNFKFIQSNHSKDHKKISEEKYSHEKFHYDSDFSHRKNIKNTHPSIQSSKRKSQKGQNNKLIHQSLVSYQNQPEQNNQKQITLPSPQILQNHIRHPSRRHHSLSAASYKNQIQQQLKKIDTRRTVILEEQSDGSSQKNSNPVKQKNQHQKPNPFREQEFPLKFSPNHSRKSTEKQKRHYSQTLIQLMQDSRQKINRRAYDQNLLEEVEQNFIKNRQMQRQKIRKIIRENMKKQARNSYDNYFLDDGYQSSDTFNDINESSEKAPQNFEGLKTLPNIQKVIESKKQFKHARKIIQNSTEKSKFSNNAENCSEENNLNQVRDQLKQYSQIVQQKNLIHKQDIYNQIDSKIKDSFWNSNMESNCKKSSLQSKKTKKIQNQSLKGSSSALNQIIQSISQPITQILKAKGQNELNQTFRTPQNQIQTPEPRTFHDNFFINRVSSENSDQDNKISQGLFNNQGTFITSSQQNGTDHDIDFRNSDLRTLLKTKQPQFTQTFQQKISNSLENNIQSKNSQNLQSCSPYPISLLKQESDQKLSNENNQSVQLQQKILKLSDHRESDNSKQINEQYLPSQTIKAEKQMKTQNTQKTSINGLKKLKQRLLQKNNISLTSPLLENQLKIAKSGTQKKLSNSNDHMVQVNLTESGKLSEKDTQFVQCSQIHQYDTGNKKSDALQAKKYQFSVKQSDNSIGSSKFRECVTQKHQITQNKRQNQVILQGPNKQFVYNTKQSPIVIKLQNLKNSPIPSLSSKLPAISFNKKLKQGHLKVETRLIDEKNQFCKSPMLKKDYYRIQPLTQRKEVQAEKFKEKQVYLQNLPQNSGYQFNQSIEILPNSGAFNSIYYDKQNQQIYKYKWFKFK